MNILEKLNEKHRQRSSRKEKLESWLCGEVGEMSEQKPEYIAGL